MGRHLSPGHLLKVLISLTECMMPKRRVHRDRQGSTNAKFACEVHGQAVATPSWRAALVNLCRKGIACSARVWGTQFSTAYKSHRQMQLADQG